MLALGSADGKCTALPAHKLQEEFEFPSDINTTTLVGTLQNCSTVSFDADNGNFLVTGRDPDGTAAVWLAPIASFVKVENNAYGRLVVSFVGGSAWRALGKRQGLGMAYSPDEIVDLSMGSLNVNRFATAVGNKDAYKIDMLTSTRRCTSVGAKEFYSEPWFNRKPEAVASLMTCLGVEFDTVDGRYYVLGVDEAGTLRIYSGFHLEWVELDTAGGIAIDYDTNNFYSFALGFESSGNDIPEDITALVLGRKTSFKLSWKRRIEKAEVVEFDVTTVLTY